MSMEWRFFLVVLSVWTTIAVIGWGLAIWVDPGAINMALAGTIAVVVTAVAGLVARLTR